jgi:hypothetical protein
MAQTETLKLKLDRGDALKGIKQVEGAVDDVKSKASKPLKSSNIFKSMSIGSHAALKSIDLVKGGLIALGGAVSVGAIVSLGKNSLQTAREIDELSKRLLLSTDAVQVMQDETRKLGLDMTDIEGVIGGLVAASTDLLDPAHEMHLAFKTLGIDVQEFISASNTRKLELYGESLSKVANNAEVARAQVKILGETDGIKLRELFENLGTGVGNLANQLDNAGRLANAESISEAAQATRDFEAAWDRLSKETLPVATKAISGLVTGIQGLTKKGGLVKVLTPERLIGDLSKSKRAREMALENASQARANQTGLKGVVTNQEGVDVELNMFKEQQARAAEKVAIAEQEAAVQKQKQLIIDTNLKEISEARAKTEELKEKLFRAQMSPLQLQAELQGELLSLSNEISILDESKKEDALKIEELKRRELTVTSEIGKVAGAINRKNLEDSERASEASKQASEERMSRLKDVNTAEKEFALSLLSISEQKFAREEELKALNVSNLDDRERALELEGEILNLKGQITAETERTKAAEESRLNGLESTVNRYDRQGSSIRGLREDISSLEEAQKEGIEGSEQALEEAKRGLSDALKSDSVKQFESQLSDSLMNIASGAENGFDSLTSSVQRFVMELIAAQIQASILQPMLDSVMNSGSGGVGTPGINPAASGGSGGTKSGFVSSMVSLMGGFFGGGAGAGAGAVAHFGKRFHNGGMAGDEMPAIVRRGEEIVPPATQQALSGQNGGQSTGVTVVAFDDREKVDVYLQKNPQAVMVPLSQNKEVFKRTMA